MSKNPTQGTIQQQIIALFVKGFGTGLSPWMPGTCGSLLAMLVVYIVGTLQLSLILQIVFTIAFTLLSWFLIYLYEAQTHKHDDSQVVIDEFAGIFITFIGIAPVGLHLLAGFILFRILDIVKPFPIGWIDKNLPGAAGTLLDDVVAGVVACALLHFIVLQGWL